MKKIIHTIICIIIALLITSSACEEIINPKDDDVLVEKTLLPSLTEQVISYNNEISITVPANTITKETKFSIEKANNIPTLTLQKIILGSNAFKIKINGQQSFSTPIVITINYDESKIPSGQTIDETVKGLIYNNNNWSIANYTLDKINNKILIYISNFKSKVQKKANPDLQGDEDSETIVIPGYSQTDTGSGDLTIKTMTKIFIIFNYGQAYDRSLSNICPNPNDSYKSSLIGKILWTGDNFSCIEDTNPGAVDTSFGQSFMYIHTLFNIGGTIKSNDQTLLTSFIVSIYKIFEDTAAWFSKTDFETNIVNIPLVYHNETKDTLIYELSTPSTNSNLITFKFDYWYADGLSVEDTNINLVKSDLVKIRIMFVK